MRPLILATLFLFSGILSAFPQQDSNFTLWQLPSQIDGIGNSYVFQMENGKVVVMDGGLIEDTEYLKGFLAALGNHVEAWFISHPHGDHMGALNQILMDPDEIRIKTIFHSAIPPSFYMPYETDSSTYSTKKFYNNLSNSGIEIVNFTEPGVTVEIDRTKFKILSVANPDITVNAYNNSSMAIRVWDAKKSMLFLGDMGAEGGDRLLTGPYRKDLDCDYIQMAHHGQQGVRKDFYRSIDFRVCLWPTPSWVYQNDQGEGYNTGNLETIEIRDLMDSLGIKEHHISFKGLTKIEGL
ncbi:MAG: MBL fold metallo-hydrolase [Bacteroidota bacterium]